MIRAPARRLTALNGLVGLVGLIVLATLAGCTSIPRTGPVVVGQPVNSDPREGVLQAILEPPIPGQSPTDVVRGFINAAVGFGDDHNVARRFLAPEKRLIWTPDASADVYPTQSELAITETGDRTAGTSATAKRPARKSAAPSARPSAAVPAADERATVVVTTPITGSIDAAGRYTQASGGQAVKRTFTLIRSEGDWRIADLENGILVSSGDFAVTFRPFPVYFSDRAGRYLVPDVHWLPANRDDSGTGEVPTALVGALLAGPSRYLQGAVFSGAPPGTRMAVAAVVVNDQIATVDLTEQVRAASTRNKQLLLAQLRATLGIGAISGVQITVRRTPLDIPSAPDAASEPGNPAAADGVPAQVQGLVDPQVDDDPVVVSQKGQIARLAGRTVTQVSGVDGLDVPGANRPALRADLSAYAVLNGDRSRLLMQLPQAKVSTLVRGATLTAPSFDPWSWVWTSDRVNPGWVSAAQPVPGRVKVAAAWLAGRTVIALRISREGARALVAIEYRGRAHVFIAGVVRDENGQPVELTQPLGLLPDLETVIDASWMDEDQIVVLGHRKDRDGDQPWIVQVGGQVKPTLAIANAQSVSAANGELGLMVGADDGTWTLVGKTWNRISSARWATYAG